MKILPLFLALFVVAFTLRAAHPAPAPAPVAASNGTLRRSRQQRALCIF